MDGSSVRERFLSINSPTHICAFVPRSCDDCDAGQIASTVLQVVGMTRTNENRTQPNRVSASAGRSAYFAGRLRSWF